RDPHPARHHVLRERTAAVKRVTAVRPDHPPHMATRRRRPHRVAIPELGRHIGWDREPVTAPGLTWRAVTANVVVRQPRTTAVTPCFAPSIHRDSSSALAG
ncbi:MAG: hypothetical protein LC808_39020, partial [Actinobacteria bacterium]|nr:hypothetical protein [Actinomycetota bacterium]